MGLAGGADVILIPEISYEVAVLAGSIRHRSRSGKRFSIVAVAEGAMSIETAAELQAAQAAIAGAADKKARKAARTEVANLESARAGKTLRLATQLEQITELESRLTILGYLQQGEG